jgi:hypothetical protein
VEFRLKIERENLVYTDNISDMIVWIISDVTQMTANFWVFTPCIPVDMYKPEKLVALVKGYMTAWPLKLQYTSTRLHDVIFHTCSVTHCSQLGKLVITISLKMPAVKSKISEQ